MSQLTEKRLSFVINTFYFVIIGTIIALIFKYGISLLMPFILAIALVAMIQPIINWLTKTLQIKAQFLATSILALLYALLAFLIFWLVVKFIQLVGVGIEFLPYYYQTAILPAINDFMNWSSTYINDPQFNHLVVGLNESLMKWLQNLIGTFSQKGVSLITSFTKNLASYFITFLFTIMLSFSINMQYDGVKKFIRAQLPEGAKKVVVNIQNLFVNVFGKYIRSYIILMFITFIELLIGFFILKIPGAVPIAAVIALLDALPILGTGTFMIPWVVVELFQRNFELAFWLFVIYSIITVIRRIIEPKVVGKQLGMNPIVSLLSIYLGYRIFGFLGMIFAPVVAQIFVELHNDGTLHLYKKHPQENDNIDENSSPAPIEDSK